MVQIHAPEARAINGGSPSVVVGDIDRGGVLAAFYGTVALLEPADQALVAGFVVSGTGTKPLLIRAVGPTLAHFTNTAEVLISTAPTAIAASAPR